MHTYLILWHCAQYRHRLAEGLTTYSLRNKCVVLFPTCHTIFRAEIACAVPPIAAAAVSEESACKLCFVSKKTTRWKQHAKNKGKKQQQLYLRSQISCFLKHFFFKEFLGQLLEQKKARISASKKQFLIKAIHYTRLDNAL